MPEFFSIIKTNGIPVKGLRPESGATPPASPNDGQLWNDTSSTPSVLKRYTSAGWVQVGISYSIGTQAQIATGTDTTPQVWTAKGLKDSIQASAPVISVASKTGAVTLVKGDVGLGSVDNTSDASKPVSTATQTALNAKANLASPALTGSPTAPTPTSGQGIANKDYVDGLVSGIDNKFSARAATTANITLSGLLTLDGVALVAGDIALVKNQTSQPANGLYTVASGAWVRIVGADVWDELVSAFTFVEEGTTQKDTGWISTADRGGTLGTTPIVWTQFSSAGVITAGTGLTKNGEVISIANGGVGATQLAAGAVVLQNDRVSGVLPINKGGTGATIPIDARAELLAASSKRILVPECAAGVWTEIPGSFELSGSGVSAATSAQFQSTSGTSREFVWIDYRHTSTGTIEIRPDISLSANDFVMILMGIGL